MAQRIISGLCRLYGNRALYISRRCARAVSYTHLDVYKRQAFTKVLERTGKGINTVLGEGGMKLSGGERQRLSIARALIRNPQLLIFDEATSALDSITEESITETIREISASRERITILIAHRLSTIMYADCIFVLEQGKIVEQGTHEKLVNDRGLYYACLLYTSRCV